DILVKGALFSAVLTAFLIDSYQDLKPQPPSESTIILRQISAQLASFRAHAGYMNSAQPSFDDSPIGAEIKHPSLAVIIINALWFSALVCSLSSVSIGIAVRQWLNHHDNEPIGVDPLVSVRIWHVRHEAYMHWHIAGLVDLLPILLQASLVLFSIGLIVLLCSLHPAVGDIIMAQTAVLWMVLFLTTISPSLRRRCSYKSPQELWIIQVIYCRVSVPQMHL
ncbi:hypothetical protein WOLCODRAFT_85943, partial [Wolfiporia cocos MD-104 SS10]